MIANIASAKLPTIATRSASCGVSGGRRSSGELDHRAERAGDLPEPLGRPLERAEPPVV